MTFNVGEKIYEEPFIENMIDTQDNIALILMNDTFQDVKTYPKIWNLEPIPENTTLSCTTVGFSLIGRNLSEPINDRVLPMTYNLQTQFNLTQCTIK